MKIALMHFHLKTGGVSTVIRQQINCLKPWAEILLLTGEPVSEALGAETVHIPEIAYDRLIQTPVDPEAVARSIKGAIQSRWEQGCDVLHVHNPLLAKNKSFLKLLKILEHMGIRLFLQIHDLAEDGRPTVYFKDDYPERCWYGVINSRDYDILASAGVKSEGLFKLFNMVNLLPPAAKSAETAQRVVYPVRALRRKNIGEAILLSLFFKDASQLVITLPPNSDQDIAAYLDWQRFVKEQQLNVGFEWGLSHDFLDLVHTSKFILTTSITEGFGFCFLEPWTAGKFLWGRYLPKICDDFRLLGIDLTHLYHRLLLPVDWIGGEALFQKWSHAMETAMPCFGTILSRKTLIHQFETILSDGLVDFGFLDEILQRQVIQRVLKNPASVKRLIELNPFLKDLDLPKRACQLIEHNQRVIRRHYSAQAYAQCLKQIYQAMGGPPPIHAINKKKILEAFLTPANTSLLKWSRYVPN